MKSLIIKDLSRAEVLDCKAMAAVHGGMYKGMPSLGISLFDGGKHDFSFSASQVVGQSQNTLVNNGNNVAFASDITSTVKPTQSANNNIRF